MRLLQVLQMTLLSSLTGYSTGYVGTVQAVPQSKHLAWLNRMTDKFCSTAYGQISHEMMDSAHELIYAWAHLDGKDCALKAESLVKRVVDERRAGNLDATMSLSDYNLLLEGWARSKAGVVAAERCGQILMEMQEHSDIKPDLDSFKTVLMAWRVSDDSDAAVRAQRVLEYMINLYVSGQNALACPDSDCFDITLQLWARSGHPDAPRQTEQLVIAMERLYHATRREKIQPKTTSFNAVLAAWSKSKDVNAVKHCMDILRFMETNAKLGDTAIEPDMVTYSTCISSLARFSGSAAKAESLLGRIESAALSGNSKLEPDTILFNSVMSCWARTTETGAYRKARSVLDRQINLHRDTGNLKSKPDVYGFTTVLASCAMEPKEKYKAFQVAMATFQQLRHSDQYGTPNHVTYGTMMKCCARLINPSNPLRRKWVKFVMTQAIEDGCVGDMVMGRFREASPPDLFREIMEGVNKKNLPEAWSANVDEKRDCRKRRGNAIYRRAAEV